MFGQILLIILLSLGQLALASLLMTAIKLRIYRGFDFIYEKRLWLEYLIFNAIAIILIDVFVVIGNSFTFGSIILNFLIVVGVLSIVEYFYFYRKYFNYEGTGRFISAMIIADLVIGIVNVVLLYFASVLLFIILAMVV